MVDHHIHLVEIVRDDRPLNPSPCLVHVPHVPEGVQVGCWVTTDNEQIAGASGGERSGAVASRPCEPVLSLAGDSQFKNAFRRAAAAL